MIGGMIAATVAVDMFGLTDNPSLGSLIPAIFVALALSMAGCGLLNATIERVAYKPLRRAPRLVPLITAIGMSFILEDIALIWKGAQPVSLPAQTLPSGTMFTIGTCPNCVEIAWSRLFILLITVPTLIGLVWLVRFTRQGKAMRATAQDKDAAAMMGIDVNRTISFTFLIAGVLAGGAGTLFAFYFTTIRYDTGFTIGSDRVHGGGPRRDRQPRGGRPRCGADRSRPGVQRGPHLALPWACLDGGDRLHDLDPHPRLPASGAARRANARGRLGRGSAEASGSARLRQRRAVSMRRASRAAPSDARCPRL